RDRAPEAEPDGDGDDPRGRLDSRPDAAGHLRGASPGAGRSPPGSRPCAVRSLSRPDGRSG
ncbi:hypothetical protein LTR94_033006, partial [Friedmanniomyces endolithicus]